MRINLLQKTTNAGGNFSLYLAVNYAGQLIKFQLSHPSLPPTMPSHSHARVPYFVNCAMKLLVVMKSKIWRSRLQKLPILTIQFIILSQLMKGPQGHCPGRQPKWGLNNEGKKSKVGSEGSRRLRVSQISRQSSHAGGKVVSPTHRPPLPPRKYS